LAVLSQVGIERLVKQARSLEQLLSIALDLDSTEISLAIQDALHPASGKPEEDFRWLRESHLKGVLKSKFADLRKDREKVLRRGKQPDWSDDLILNKDGAVKPNLANLVLILREQPAWKGVLGFDEFATHVVILKCPPWGDVRPGTSWSDHFDSLTRIWLQRDGRINAAMGDVGRAVQAAARNNSFNAVAEYFDALVWDQVPRLETWLSTYLHAEDSEYIRAIGPRYLISAVARVYQPGCKADHVLVLEGPQGKLKSEALRILAVCDEWFTDRLSNLASKDAAQELAGVLIVEIAEMDALVRASSSTAKSYLTRCYDRIRLPYGRHLTRRPRQNVFAATINPPIGGYLRDPTGDRRFWPVPCRLSGLLEAVTHFAIGGRQALDELGNRPAALLLEQMSGQELESQGRRTILTEE
jgi:hypothetical protein